MTKLGKLWRQRKGVVLGLAVILAGSIAYGGYRIARPSLNLPSALVERAEFVDYVDVRAQASARKSVTMAAPFEAGDLQIIQLAQNGSQVKKGDVVVQFDATTTRQNLAQDESALKSADDEIKQSRAQAHLKEEQDLTDVMKAKYGVQSARLDASKQEIVSKIEGAEANLALSDAEQKEKDVEAKMKSDQQADAADIESKKEKRDQAAYNVQQAERSLALLTLRAPSDGLVTLMNNWRASGPFNGGAPFKQGDRAWSGAAIAELPDLSTMEISGRIDETQRGRVQIGQTATVKVDAIPDKEFTAKVASISEIASMDFSGGWPFPRNFTIKFALANSDPRLRPGMSANVRIAVDKVPNGIIIPSEAMFRKSGQSVAYVIQGSKFEERPIEVARRSGDQLLIAKGLQAGERVALRDPTATP
ncbi:MAG TPA: efflux RND transporter periplasmic adaptor subunit [Candidatus Acidoferrales bacterium]|nr:efflux RND transporter periplasmic adaptor subunit [Candidatus Acidoferrales bacterium]